MESWGEVEQSGDSKEFIVSAQLHISAAAAVALRKPLNPRKKGDKRESVKQLIGNVDDKKLKEKSSWLSGSKGPSSRGQWRPATCKLSEQGDRCLLNIYVDESIMWCTAYIHLLNQTDIREASASLFSRKDCLSIHCAAGKPWAASSSLEEPIYLQFNSTNACNTWLALLRSYALPEIYGRWFFPAEGGSYRMWRQVDLTVIQGRNLGNNKPFEILDEDGNDSASEPDPIDLDVYCEILLNETLCARTTVKKGIGSPQWHEIFVLSDLPPFEGLDIWVWREKKHFKPSVLGTVRIALNNFRRGEAVEGWFPVLQSGSIASDIQVGELRMKIRVDEEIILPYSAYHKLLKTFRARNFLDWMSDFETKLKLKTIGWQMMAISIANNTAIEQVQERAHREVDGSQSSHTTLFRGNTILTKIVELCMKYYGKAFLEASVGPIIRRLIAEKVAIEVDPMRTPKGAKEAEKGLELLIYWCQEFWKQIYSVREECPPEMRRLFCTIRELVEERFSSSGNSAIQAKHDLRWQGVSAFCFLRFIVPAILNPHLFHLYPGLPSPPVQRSLTLIAKVIQSLANLNQTVQKEEFMRGVKHFLAENSPAMVDYIVVVSTPVKDFRSGKMADWHERSNVINALKSRASSMPILYRESIPLLPHTLDVPRQLAIVTSAVIRHSQAYFTEDRPSAEDEELHEFCARCFEVEEQALQRVSQLAAQLSANQQRRHFSYPYPSTSSIFTQPSSPGPPSSPSSRRADRPATAPDAENSRTRLISESTNSLAVPPSSPSHPITFQSRNKLLHFKSSSTDSIGSRFAKDAPSSPSILVSTSSSVDIDDPKRKRGLLRGIWRR
ncbi:GTPase activating protein [Lentinula aff. detonsa]|uniref:GTPase activating protein n=1 Tax=Lentinula aff. detonsa TaxID=2804958 RepID=A0AA38NTU6_9AGAR|nr:GTPase activating protein [Lentinula aff. detonsa]